MRGARRLRPRQAGRRAVSKVAGARRVGFWGGRRGRARAGVGADSGEVAVCNWVCTSLLWFRSFVSGAATHRRPCALIVPWSRAYFVATVRVERNFWTCRFCETWGSVCESAERFGTAPICEPRTLASIRDGHKTCYTAPKSYCPHLRRERLHLDATAPASCKNLAVSAPSRGVISIPALGPLKRR